MARIIAVANQKGGVGKTTTAVNLAACLATAGQTTLLVDCDSQANATAAIGFQKDPSRRTLYHSLILNEPFDRITQKSQVEHLDVVPADKNLAGAAVELVSAEGREYKLKAVLGELGITLSALAMNIIENNRFTETRRLRQSNIAGNYALKNLRPKETA